MAKTTDVRFQDERTLEFIDGELPRTHPKFRNITGQYDHVLDTFLPTDDTASTVLEDAKVPDAQIAKRTEAFKQALKTFTPSNAGSSVAFDETKQVTWSDVLDEVKKTQDEYDAKADRDKGLIASMRGRLRSFDRVADRVEPWLQLAPSESWQGSLICGGIKVILQVSPAG